MFASAAAKHHILLPRNREASRNPGAVAAAQKVGKSTYSRAATARAVSATVQRDLSLSERVTKSLRTSRPRGRVQR
jgi:hypothetical protein